MLVDTRGYRNGNWRCGKSPVCLESAVNAAPAPGGGGSLFAR